MKTKEKLTEYLKLVSGGKRVFISRTKGDEVLETKGDDCWEASIPGYDFVKQKEWNGHLPSLPQQKVEVEVYSISKNGDFKDFFGSFKRNLDHLSLTRAQVAKFLEANKKWLSKGGTTFFLIGTKKKFVVGVTRDPRGSVMTPSVFRFNHHGPWSIGWPHQVVIPKLK